MQRYFGLASLLAALGAGGCVGEPEDLPVYRPGRPLAFRTSFALVEGEITVEAEEFRQGDNVLLVSAEEAGDSVPELVAATAFMAAHSHGTEPAIVSRGDDGYRVDRLLLFMGGRWEITLEFAVGRDRDTFVFAADVP